MVDPKDREQLRETVGRVGYVKNLDINLVGKCGDVRVVAASIHKAQFNGQECFITTVMDITERTKLERELTYLPQTDVLTGIANRRHFMHQAKMELSRALRYGSAVSLLMLDIDHFKSINDTYGHQVGDIVIHELARLCKDVFRDVDIAGRIGGEEFAVLLPQSGAEGALRAAERLRQAVVDASVPREQGLPVRFTISIGVATLIEPVTDLETLLGFADQALYQAKHGGRNRVCAYACEQ